MPKCELTQNCPKLWFHSRVCWRPVRSKAWCTWQTGLPASLIIFIDILTEWYYQLLATILYYLHDKIDIFIGCRRSLRPWDSTPLLALMGSATGSHSGTRRHFPICHFFYIFLLFYVPHFYFLFCLVFIFLFLFRDGDEMTRTEMLYNFKNISNGEPIAALRHGTWKYMSSISSISGRAAGSISPTSTAMTAGTPPLRTPLRSAQVVRKSSVPTQVTSTNSLTFPPTPLKRFSVQFFV